MSNINFLIKPASGTCNMRCTYCFYKDEMENRSQKNMGIMTKETCRKLITSAFAFAGKHDLISFTFQGGEPTLAGIEFFYYFTEQVDICNVIHLPVQYSLQTNGYCIDKNWIELFSKYHFLIGISLDGTKALHDTYRLDTLGKGTWNTVSHTIQLLLKNNIDINLLCVVTRQCSRSPQRVYSALKKTGAPCLQFIACLDPLEHSRGTEPFSLLPDAYGNFLCGLFDAWYLDWKSGAPISIRLFEDYIQLAMGLPASTCATSGRCGGYLVIEADGSVYPCDFYALDKWKLGNIATHDLFSLFNSEVALAFQNQRKKLPAACTACRWQALCHGGCPRDWYSRSGKIENYYCSSFQTFFEYAEPRISEIVQYCRRFSSISQ